MWLGNEPCVVKAGPCVDRRSRRVEAGTKKKRMISDSQDGAETKRIKHRIKRTLSSYLDSDTHSQSIFIKEKEHSGIGLGSEHTKWDKIHHNCRIQREMFIINVEYEGKYSSLM